MRPGVYVEESPLPRVIEPPTFGFSAGAFIGTALMGPTEPILLTSWSQFVSTFGNFSSDDDRTSLAPAVYQFFANGGGQCYVCRVLAGDAEAARTTLVGETGNTSLNVKAASAGFWGNGLSVTVTSPQDIGQLSLDVDNRRGPFSMQFAPDFDRPMDLMRPLTRLDGTHAPLFNIEVFNTIRGTQVVVERFNGLSLDPNDARYAPRIINDSSVGSRFIQIVDETNGTQTGIPAAVDRQALMNGTDGSSVPGSTSFIAAVDEFELIEGNLVFNIPGASDVAGAEDKIAQRGDSFLVVDAPNKAVSEALSQALTVTSYSAVYYPYIAIADPDPGAARGSLKWVPPGGSVAGMILRTDSSRGAFKAPAGVGASLTGALATSYKLNNADLDTLNNFNINAIRPVPGSGITVMGARTRDFQTAARYISVRRTLNYVKSRATTASRFALFEPNTPVLWEQLRVANGAFLSDLWDEGGLAGSTLNQAFYVKVDSDNNTAQTIANGEVHVEIGVAPVYPTEFVIIRLGQFESDAGFVVTEGFGF